MDDTNSINIRQIYTGITNLLHGINVKGIGGTNICIPLPVGNYEKGLTLQFSVELHTSSSPIKYVTFTIQKKTEPLNIKRGEVIHLPLINGIAEYEAGNYTDLKEGSVKGGTH